MLSSIVSLVFLFVGLALSQTTATASSETTETTSSTATHRTTSLWIPFKTVSGLPQASIAADHPNENETVYVISCPTAEPNCAIAPDMTLTEGGTTAGYSTTNSAGTAWLGCSMADATSAVCSNVASGQGQVEKGTMSTLAPSQIVFQAVEVTATNDANVDSTNAASPGSSSDQGTASSVAVAIRTTWPWTTGGAIGAVLVALVFL